MIHQLHFNANLTLLFSELPLLERFILAKSAGFKAVELLSNEGVEFSLLAEEVKRNELRVVLCNAPVADFPTGGLGLSGVPSRQQEFTKAISTAVEMVKTLDCKKIQIGPSRIPKDSNRNECLSILKDNINFAAEKLEIDGLKLLVEPLNSVDIPDILLDDIEQVVALIDDCPFNNVELQLDIYHLARMELNIEHMIEKYAEYIGHIQIADNPGRGQPGSGKINFHSVFKAIKNTDYSGWIGAEYLPIPNTTQSLDWLNKYQ